MHYLVVLVLDDPSFCGEILQRWEEAGATGVTILESTGLGRLRKKGIRDDYPLMPSLQEFLKGAEVHNRTLFSIVESEAIVDALIDAVEQVVGDLERPDTGLLFVVPVHKAIGLGTTHQGTG
jgi:nitrogen regulatory protein PII